MLPNTQPLKKFEMSLFVRVERLAYTSISLVQVAWKLKLNDVKRQRLVKSSRALCVSSFPACIEIPSDLRWIPQNEEKPHPRHCCPDMWGFDYRTCYKVQFPLSVDFKSDPILSESKQNETKKRKEGRYQPTNLHRQGGYLFSCPPSTEKRGSEVSEFRPERSIYPPPCAASLAVADAYIDVNIFSGEKEGLLPQKAEDTTLRRTTPSMW